MLGGLSRTCFMYVHFKVTPEGWSYMMFTSLFNTNYNPTRFVGRIVIVGETNGGQGVEKYRVEYWL